MISKLSLTVLGFALLVSSVLLSLLAAAYPQHHHNHHHHQQQQEASSTATPANANLTNPYWRRPGCYRVGHTRTISIPGCVKFNLSTNACRGYCMSYSIPIPANQESGSLGHAEPLLGNNGDTASNQLANLGSITSAAASAANNNAPLVVAANQAVPVSGVALPARHLKLAENEEPETRKRTKGKILTQESAGQKEETVTETGEQILRDFDRLKQDEWERLAEYPPIGVAALSAGQTLANKLFSVPDSSVSISGLKLGYIGGSVPAERDVISVSQCCNMMETEDVVVNLRCGVKEVKQLVFKSAKTCECLFCKNV